MKQTAGRENLGELAPKFAELNDDVLVTGKGIKPSWSEPANSYGFNYQGILWTTPLPHANC